MRSSWLVVVASLSLGCGAAGGGDNLEAALGGLDFSAEQPLFGPTYRPQFEAAGEANALQQASTAEDPSGSPGTHAVWVGWGHFLADRAEMDVLDWSGTLHAGAGSLDLLRTVAFDRNDHVLPPPDGQSIAFTSHTRPHFDGLVARLAYPGTPPALTLDTPSLSATHQPGAAPVKEVLPVPGTDAQVLFLSLPLDAARPCAQAVVGGRWRAVAERRPRGGSIESRLLGRWLTPTGERVGHWRAFAGHRADGSEVLFGKVISPEGEALALLRGTLAEHHAQVDVLDGAGGVLGHVRLDLDVGDASRAAVLEVAQMERCLGP